MALKSKNSTLILPFSSNSIGPPGLPINPLSTINNALLASSKVTQPVPPTLG